MLLLNISHEKCDDFQTAFFMRTLNERVWLPPQIKQAGANKRKNARICSCKSIKSKRSEQSIMPKKKVIQTCYTFSYALTLFFFFFFLELRDPKKARLMLLNQSQIHANKKNNRMCDEVLWKMCQLLFLKGHWQKANSREKKNTAKKHKIYTKNCVLFIRSTWHTREKHSFFPHFTDIIFSCSFFFNLFFFLSI